jgi:Recombination endonuclease VII
MQGLGVPTRPYAGSRSERAAGAPPGMKACPDCQRVLSVDAFVRNKRQADGVGTYCRPCQNKRTNESRQRRQGGSRQYHLKRRYGIGAEDVVNMLRDQLRRCPICATALTLKTTHVDHDHKTGSVRAVLCFKCNSGLGQFKDNPDALRRAAAYLEGEMWHAIKLAPGVYQLPSSLQAARALPTSSVTTRRSSSLGAVHPPLLH